MKQKEFMPDLVNTEISLEAFWKQIKSAKTVLWHGLTPHGRAKNPTREFKSNHIQPNDFLWETANEFYKDTSARIAILEEKAFKLVTYISAITALLIYFLGAEAEGAFKYLIILALVFLTLAILISLRCIGVKSQKALYIDSIFQFNDDPNIEPHSKNKEEIIAALINCAVFNHNVADSTADILKASRIMLSIGIITTLISCTFFIFNPNQKKASIETIVSFKDRTTFRPLFKNLINLDSSLNRIQFDLNSIKKGIEQSNLNRKK